MSNFIIIIGDDVGWDSRLHRDGGSKNSGNRPVGERTTMMTRFTAVFHNVLPFVELTGLLPRTMESWPMPRKRS